MTDDEKKENKQIAPPMKRIEVEYMEKGEVKTEWRDVYQGDIVTCRVGRRRIGSADIARRCHYNICYLRCYFQKGGCQAFDIFMEDHPELFKGIPRTRKFYRGGEND